MKYFEFYMSPEIFFYFFFTLFVFVYFIWKCELNIIFVFEIEKATTRLTLPLYPNLVRFCGFLKIVYNKFSLLSKVFGVKLRFFNFVAE